MDTQYRARPIHLYTLALPLLVLGTVGMGLGDVYFWLGVVTFFLGIGAGFCVVVILLWQAYADYLSEKAYHGKTIAQTMQTLSRIKDPNVWSAMGYELPTPEPAKIEEMRTDPKVLPRLTFPTPPATPPQMKLLANDVLRGGSMSEGRWQGKGKAFPGKSYTELMKWGEHPDRKYWVFINPTHPKLGRTPTRNGTSFLLYYADEEVKKLFETKGRETAMSELAASHPNQIGRR